MKTILLALVLTLATATAFAPADAKRHSTRHPFGHHPEICANCELVPTAAGIRIVCDRRWCAAFQAFIRDLIDQGYKPREIVCYSRGHMHGSNHDGGGACDFDQRGRNRTAHAMYRVTAIAKRHGLHDGCLFRHRPDCGHIEGPVGLCNYGQCNRAYARRHEQHYRDRPRSYVYASALRSWPSY